MTVSVRHFLSAQALGQAADAITAVVVADVVLSGGAGTGGGVAPDRLLSTICAASVPYLIAGPLGGIIADRFDRRRTLGVFNVLRAVITIVAAVAVVADSRSLALVATATLLGAARVVYNLRAAAAARLVNPSRLVGFDASALFVGMAAVGAGGALAAVVGSRAPVSVLAVAAVLQIGSAIGFATVRCDLGGGARSVGAGLRTTVGRFAALLATPPTRWAIAITTAQRLLLGAAFATYVLIASNTYGLGSSGYLLAAAVSGFGSMLGTCTATRAHAWLGPARLVVVGFVVPACMLLLGTLVPTEAMVAVAVASSFFVFQNVRIVADATVQASIADTSRARVFAIYDALYNLAYYAGAAVAVGAVRTSAGPEMLGLIAAVYAVLAIGSASAHALSPWPVRVAEPIVAIRADPARQLARSNP